MPGPNPFQYGSPIPPERFVGRRRLLQRLTRRLLAGQSVALTGEPRLGKSSILNYLAAPENRPRLYREQAPQLIFSNIDASLLPAQFDQMQFWVQALKPISVYLQQHPEKQTLAQSLSVCEASHFGTFVLEQLFNCLSQLSLKLVLVIDEFDVLLGHSVFNSAEFFGSLRAITTRANGALVMVVAGRRTLSELDNVVREYNHGSPYFNFFNEFRLTVFDPNDVLLLISRARNRFKISDQRFIRHVAGGHPYLLQIACYELWELYHEKGTDESCHLSTTADIIYQAATHVMADTWQHWTPAVRMVITIIALNQAPTLLHREFDSEELLYDLQDFAPELRQLEQQGFICKTDSQSLPWKIRPTAFLWWLADELTRTVRNKDSFDGWLQNYEVDGGLRKGHWRKFNILLRAVPNLFKSGLGDMIEIAIDLAHMGRR